MKAKVQKKKTSTKKSDTHKKKAIRRYRFFATKIGSKSKKPVICDVISTGPTCAYHEFERQYPDWCAWNYDDPLFICYTEDPGELFPDAIKTALDLERVEEAAKAEAEKMKKETL